MEPDGHNKKATPKLSSKGGVNYFISRRGQQDGEASETKTVAERGLLRFGEYRMSGPPPPGQPSPGQPPFGQPPYGQPPYGQPPHGQQPHGQQPHGQPPHGQPPYGQPPQGQPPQGQPPYGQQPHGQPPYGQPPQGSQPPFGQQPPHGHPPPHVQQSPYGQQPPYGQSPYGQLPGGQPPATSPPGTGTTPYPLSNQAPGSGYGQQPYGLTPQHGYPQQPNPTNQQYPQQPGSAYPPPPPTYGQTPVAYSAHQDQAQSQPYGQPAAPGQHSIPPNAPPAYQDYTPATPSPYGQQAHQQPAAAYHGGPSGPGVDDYADTPLQPMHSQPGPPPRIDFAMSCSNLRDRDLVGKSDPFVRVLVRFAGEMKWHKAGSTETRNNELNPQFMERVPVDYYFEQQQELRFEVIDYDKARSLPGRKSGESLGYYECSLATAVSCGGGQINAPLSNGKGGSILIVAEDHERSKDAYEFAFQGLKLKSRDGPFSKSDPYLKLMSMVIGGQNTLVAQTEVLKNNANPAWNPLTISVNQLCGGDFQKSIQIDCFDADDGSKDDLIGSGITNLGELTNPGLPFHKELTRQSKPGKSQGTLVLARPPTVTKMYDFTDFLHGGLEIDVLLAIDFTASNGDPRRPESLHYNHPDPAHANPYESAIQAVGGVLAPYDKNQSFACFGFGGVLPGQPGVSHCFALNGNESNPSVHGVRGAMEAYNTGLKNVRLSGPTHFAPVIRRATAIAAQQTPGSMRYSVLLLITDGAILDMGETVSAINEATKYPLSIVIVAVGQADFSSMHTLDGDSSKKLFARDIVQFVEFSKFQHGAGAGPKLAAETLYEIPAQVVSFFRKSKVKPKTVKKAVVGLAAAAIAAKAL